MIVMTDQTLMLTYGSRAQRIYRFIKEDIVNKHLYDRQGEEWFRSNALTISVPYSDKTAHLVHILVSLCRIDRDARYVSLAGVLLHGFQKRLRPYRENSLIWDVGLSQHGDGYSMNTSHANRMPYMLVDAFEAGFMISELEIQGLANLFVDVIWDQSNVSPQFRNFIDGRNDAVFNRRPYAIGQIYSGWIRLGAFDVRVQAVGNAVLMALVNGVKNPSLSYMAAAPAKLCLLGHLARNSAGLNRLSDSRRGRKP
jgi:hypothetical protein